MKQTKKITVLLCSLVMGILLFMQTTAYAAEGAGGQVTRTGKISFYEESTDSSSSTPASSSTAADSTNPSENASTTEAVTKPVGRYPSTGELVQKYSWLGACLLIFVFFFLFLRRRRKEKHQ